jgi:hypothetical protein
VATPTASHPPSATAPSTIPPAGSPSTTSTTAPGG